MRRRHILGYSVLLLALVAVGARRNRRAGPLDFARGGGTWEWRTYGADLASTRYAPLEQINQGNFKDLEVAWRFKTDALGPRP